jgi:hypothetical protein
MGEVLIEVVGAPAGVPVPPDDDGGLLGPRAGGRATTVALESFQARAPEIAGALRTVAEAMRSHLDATAAAPTGRGWGLDTVELGLDLSLEAGAGVVITRATAGATLSAKLSWKRSGA